MTERDIAVYVSTYNDAYTEVEDWSFATLADGSIHIRFAKPEKARYVKLHCRYDERNAEGSVRDMSTFGNSSRALVTVGYYETSRRESYVYDAQGNRESVETRLGGQTETTGYELYANSDRVRKSGDRAYVYDASGNMTERGTALTFSGDIPDYEADDYYRRYEYDLQNRLVKVWGYKEGSLVVLATYTYAGDNLRLSKTASGATTRFVHGIDGSELYRATGTDSVSTVWLFGRKLAEIEKAGVTETRTYLHTDHLGTVVAATDEAGKTIWVGDNAAFGVATADTGLESRTASYTGKDYDPEAGLYYFNARWYDAELGRFTTEDPARNGIAWYAYCENSPMLLVDPSGMVPKDPATKYIATTVANHIKAMTHEAIATLGYLEIAGLESRYKENALVDSYLSTGADPIYMDRQVAASQLYESFGANAEMLEDAQSILHAIGQETGSSIEIAFRPRAPASSTQRTISRREPRTHLPRTVQGGGLWVYA